MASADHLTERQVEREYPFLKVKRLQAWRYVRRGGPKYLRIGRNIVYPRTEIENYLQNHLVDTADA
jgi:predicted DNA-binding transcriptional regulator AlpA